ncbi:hypothetical protein [Mesonia aestuariivivens]|uniref:Uncharacterized protein n=1 Tax=Mesonia aestuariivivens TaxID=2796128 RepID=A0ABS6W2V3_9FLAO|nr:hypothetical protein [Mesonia aestuariivivens]MBW2961454.1 hypothetical protein [Mesonia aestuariivivens]
MKEKNNIPKNTGFKVPKEYFENFEVNFSLDKVNSLDQIKSSGLTTPDNYFKTLNIALPEEEPSTSKVISISRNKIFTAITTAAAVVLFIMLIYKETNVVTVNNTISQIDIEDYLEQNEFDFENEINYDNTSNLNNFQSQLNTLDSEAILEYLSNDTDMASLLNDE